MNVDSGIAMPVCHCAFRGCGWTSQRSPCPGGDPTQDSWQCSESQWLGAPKNPRVGEADYVCCNEEDCLREHVLREHRGALEEVLGSGGALQNAYCYYLEALAIKERKGMPTVGFSVDRRVFADIHQDFSNASVQALICAVQLQRRRRRRVF